MAEPINPEAYLALAATVHNALNSYRHKRAPDEQDKRTANTNTSAANSSKATAASLLPTDELLSYAGLKTDNDGHVQLVADSPNHPRNWSRRRKAYDFGLILLSEFFMSGIGAAGTPASLSFNDDGDGGFVVLGRWKMKTEVGLVAFTTMYLLGQALGALLLSPFSDRFGRRTLYVGSASLYSVFCLPVAATSNIAGVFVGRFVTGVIAAVPAVTARRSIGDLFVGSESRMWAFSSWALVTNLGLVLGPVYASYVTEWLNWRWPFYIASIIVAVTGMLMYFVRESHTPVLLERTVAAIRSHRADLILRTAPTAPRPSVFRPLILFFTNPTVFLSSLANAFSTALLYLFAVAFPLIYAHYGWSGQKTTLIFLFIALGLFSSILTRFHDRHAIRKSHLTNHPLPLENPLLGLAIGATALAVGLWWFAWTTPGSHVQTLPWPASALSLVLAGYGINEYSTTLPRYVLQPYSHNSNKKNNNEASSAFAALLIPRALLGATFPLFTGKMLQALGNNVAGSVLAAIATAFCFIPFVVMGFGTRSRRRMMGMGMSGAVVDDDGTGDDGGKIVTKVVVEEEKEKEKKPKPKKTVRFWDEEEEEEEEGEEKETAPSDSDASLRTLKSDSEVSSTETVVDKGESSMKISQSKEEEDDNDDDDVVGAGGEVETSSGDEGKDVSTHAHASSEEVDTHVPGSRKGERGGEGDGEGEARQKATATAADTGTSAGPRTSPNTDDYDDDDDDGIGDETVRVRNNDNKKKKMMEKKKQGANKKDKDKKEPSRARVEEDGYVSFLGLGLGLGPGLDVERLVGFPYL